MLAHIRDILKMRVRSYFHSIPISPVQAAERQPAAFSGRLAKLRKGE
jgi:hypothetical protein